MENNFNDGINLTMLTDFYEITMANGYFETGMADNIAYFDMFFRTIPDEGGFAVMMVFLALRLGYLTLIITGSS